MGLIETGLLIWSAFVMINPGRAVLPKPRLLTRLCAWLYDDGLRSASLGLEATLPAYRERRVTPIVLRKLRTRSNQADCLEIM